MCVPVVLCSLVYRAPWGGCGWVITFVLTVMESRGLRVAGERATVRADIVGYYRTLDGEEKELERREGVEVKLGNSLLVIILRAISPIFLQARP